MTRAINDPGNETPVPCWKPTPTPCSAVPPPRRRKSAAGSQPRPASARASATWRSASSPAGNNASTPATAPTSAASLPCCWSAAAHGRRPPASWRRAMPWHARSVAMATSRWSANVRVPAGASSRPAGHCCRPEAGHFCRRGLESECAGQADFLACPGFSFRLPRRAPLQASVRTGDIADRCAELPEKDHERRHEPERGVHFEVLIRRANNATGVIRRCRG